MKLPIRLTLTTLLKTSRSCGPCFELVRWAQPIPAQQTEIRSPPSSAAAASTAAWTWSASSTFASTNDARSPSSAASASPFSAFRSAITTDAPAPWSRRAVASPRPDAPPLISAPAPSTFIAAGALVATIVGLPVTKSATADV